MQNKHGLVLREMQESMLMGFAGIEEPDSAFWCDFDLGEEEALIITEPTTVQIHQFDKETGEPTTYGRFFNKGVDTDFNVSRAVANEILVKIKGREFESVKDLAKWAGMESLIG